MSIEFVSQEVDEIAREIDLLDTSGLKSAGTAVLRQWLELPRNQYAHFLGIPCTTGHSSRRRSEAEAVLRGLLAIAGSPTLNL
jgi:hypothetical protein